MTRTDPAPPDPDGEPLLVDIHRSIPDAAPLHGYVLRRDHGRLLVQLVDEFRLNGYAIIRERDLDHIERDESLEFQDHVMGQEGIREAVGLDTAVDLGSWARSLETVSARFHPITFWTAEPEEDLVGIGKVLDLGTREITLATVDESGHWDPAPIRLPYARISMIVFGDEYGTLYGRYARPPTMT